MGRRAPTTPPRTRLEEIRRLRLLSSVELARRAEMDPTTLWRIESGRRSLTHTWRDALALALVVPVAQLYAPIGEPIPPIQPEELALDPEPYNPAYAPPAVADRLRAIMVHAGVSALELAMAIGATETDVLDWLDGRLLPPILLMRRLAHLVGVTLGFVYHGREDGLLPGIAARLREIMDQLDRSEV